MKTKKVKINGQVELEIEEGMSVSEENGVVRVASRRSFDPADSILSAYIDRAFEKRQKRTKWKPQLGEVVTAGEVGRYIMFIY